MKKIDKDEILEVIVGLRDLMVDKFDDVYKRFDRIECRMDKVEETLNFHTNILDSHTKKLIDLKHEQTFALNRDARIEKDISLLKKKLKTV